MINVNGNKIELKKYPDGTPLLKLTAFGSVINIRWKYESDAEIFSLICITKHLRQINPDSKFILTMPYIPNARMDRVKVQMEEVFTLKYFLELINSLAFNTVKVLDPHSVVSEYGINNIEVISPQPYIDEALQRIRNTGAVPTTAFFVDNGGQKRYSEMVHLPSVFGHKNRNWDNGEIIGTEIIGDTNLVKDKDVIIIDDIIAYGGSIYYSALKLKELGCRDLYVYATHMENSILDEKKGELIRSGLIKKFYTTDSLFTKTHKLIEVIKL